tara:strand:+ start:1614 stop:1964 length:351 start_codon:yes stop_codon:yes gene_type:complete
MIKKIKSKVERLKANSVIPNLIGNLQKQFKTIWIPAFTGMTKQNVIMKKILLTNLSLPMKNEEESHREISQSLKKRSFRNDKTNLMRNLFLNISMDSRFHGNDKKRTSLREQRSNL